MITYLDMLGIYLKIIHRVNISNHGCLQTIKMGQLLMEDDNVFYDTRNHHAYLYPEVIPNHLHTVVNITAMRNSSC